MVKHLSSCRPLLPIFLKSLQQKIFSIITYTLPVTLIELRRAARDLAHQFQLIVALKWHFEAQYVVKEHARAPHIDLHVIGLLQNEFGRGVLTHHVFGWQVAAFLGEILRLTEIDKFEVDVIKLLPFYYQLLRFYVAEYYLFRMQIVQALEQLPREVTNLCFFDWSTIALLSQHQVVLHIRAKANELRHNEILRFILQDLVHLHYLWVFYVLEYIYFSHDRRLHFLLIQYLDRVLLFLDPYSIERNLVANAHIVRATLADKSAKTVMVPNRVDFCRLVQVRS